MMKYGRKIFVYAGNWTVQTPGEDGGIGIYEYSEQDGSLRFLDLVRRDLIPGMMAADEKRGVLYVADEKKDSPEFFMRGGGGRVLAFQADPSTGQLKELGAQPSFGSQASFVAVSPSGRWLAATNHGDSVPITKSLRGEDGNYRVMTEFSDVALVLYPLSRDGSVGPACDLVRFPPDFGQAPAQPACLHAVYFVPGRDRLLVTNMKQDQVLLFDIQKDGKLSKAGELSCPVGSWPRYGAFHPEKPLFYMNNERALLVNTVRCGEDGTLTIAQTLDAAPRLSCVEPEKRISQSDLRISRDGRHVYDLYRYTDALAVYEADEKTGLLKMIQSAALPGKRPRGCALSPDGRFLLIAGLSGEIMTMEILKDGTVRETGISDRSMKFPGNVTFYSFG